MTAPLVFAGATWASQGAPGVTVSFNVRSSSSGSNSETAGRVAAFQMMSATTRNTTMISGATCEQNTPLSGRIRDGEHCTRGTATADSTQLPRLPQAATTLPQQLPVFHLRPCA